jgi:hypothetical protein
MLRKETEESRVILHDHFQGQAAANAGQPKKDT